MGKKLKKCPTGMSKLKLKTVQNGAGVYMQCGMNVAVVDKFKTIDLIVVQNNFVNI